MAASAEPRRDVVEAVRNLTGLLAGAAALVYLTGGLALQLRLGLVRLPSSAAVPQLPREFLISTGLLIVAPAIAVGAGVHWASRRWLPAAVAGLACYLLIGALVVLKDPFPAKVCLHDGSELAGVLIGETGDRTYLGDPGAAHPRRVISIPASQVARVIVGGSAAQLDGVRC
jgi:hypothetical protein